MKNFQVKIFELTFVFTLNLFSLITANLAIHSTYSFVDIHLNCL